MPIRFPTNTIFIGGNYIDNPPYFKDAEKAYNYILPLASTANKFAYRLDSDTSHIENWSTQSANFNALVAAGSLTNLSTGTTTGIQGITVQEEGTSLSTLATTLNFVGANVTASGTGAVKTITITGGSGTSLPTPSANNRFLVSTGLTSSDWSTNTNTDQVSNIWFSGSPAAAVDDTGNFGFNSTNNTWFATFNGNTSRSLAVTDGLTVTLQTSGSANEYLNASGSYSTPSGGGSTIPTPIANNRMFVSTGTSDGNYNWNSPTNQVSNIYFSGSPAASVDDTGSLGFNSTNNTWYVTFNSNTQRNLVTTNTGTLTLTTNGSSTEYLSADGTYTVPAGGSGGAITIQDEGSALATDATTLNFTGTGVTASGVSATKVIDIPGLTVQDEGSALTSVATTLNFTGAGVTASGTGNVKTIAISAGGSGSLTVQEEGSTLATAADTLNFVGTGVTASGTTGTKTITIPSGVRVSHQAVGDPGFTQTDNVTAFSFSGTALTGVTIGTLADGNKSFIATLTGGSGGSGTFLGLSDVTAGGFSDKTGLQIWTPVWHATSQNMFSNEDIPMIAVNLASNSYTFSELGTELGGLPGKLFVYNQNNLYHVPSNATVSTEAALDSHRLLDVASIRTFNIINEGNGTVGAYDPAADATHTSPLDELQFTGNVAVTRDARKAVVNIPEYTPPADANFTNIIATGSVKADDFRGNDDQTTIIRSSSNAINFNDPLANTYMTIGTSASGTGSGSVNVHSNFTVASDRQAGYNSANPQVTNPTNNWNFASKQYVDTQVGLGAPGAANRVLNSTGPNAGDFTWTDSPTLNALTLNGGILNFNNTSKIVGNGWFIRGVETPGTTDVQFNIGVGASANINVRRGSGDGSITGSINSDGFTMSMVQGTTTTTGFTATNSTARLRASNVNTLESTSTAITANVPINGVALTNTGSATNFLNEAGNYVSISGGSGITVQEEGSSLTTEATTLNFTGDAVTASGTTATKVINIPGLSVQDEGASGTSTTTLNFTGAGVSKTSSTTTATVTIPGLLVEDDGTQIGTDALTLDFTGAGVTVTGAGSEKTVNIPGGGSGSVIQDSGTQEGTGITTLNFNSNLDVTVAGSTATINGQSGSVPNYSTTETTTGSTWIDGKPIYRKVINFGSLPNATSKLVAHSISNIDFIVCVEGTSYRSTDNNYIPIPWVHQTAPVGLAVNLTNVQIFTATDLSAYGETYVTVEYTKTTD